MYVLKTSLSEEERTAEITAINSILTDNGATNLEVTDWGRRELAYEIRFEKYGYYVILTLELEAGSIALNEFTRLMNIRPTVLRHLVVRK
jgi:small subunit ribosomal protein S6